MKLRPSEKLCSSQPAQFKDVYVWDEDSSRIRNPNAAQNVALLRKIALNLLKSDTTVKDTIRGKRLQATFNEDLLAQFLRLQV